MKTPREHSFEIWRVSHLDAVCHHVQEVYNILSNRVGRKKQYRYLSTVSGRCTKGMNMKRQLRSGFDVADNKALQGIGQCFSTLTHRDDDIPCRLERLP